VCGHYFCEECALSHFRKEPDCFKCKKPTNGLFNPAKKLEEQIKRRRKENPIKSKNEDENHKEIIDEFRKQ